MKFNLPVSPSKAVGLNLGYDGTVDISIDVVRGNPIDVFPMPNDQLDEAKNGCKMGAKPLSCGQKTTVAGECDN
jgi:hypothetical protein